MSTQSSSKPTKNVPAKVEDKSLAYQAVAAFLKPHIDYWLNMLRLEDWSLSVAIVDWSEEQDFWAMVAPKPWFHAAYLEVVNPFTDPKRVEKGLGSFEHDTDLEVSLVHELLHLRYEFDSLGINRDIKAIWNAYEAATEITARALVAARHGKERISAS
jgi:hypothetical protein